MCIRDSVQVGRDRLLAVDVLAGRERLGEQHRPHLRRAGVEEDRVVLVRERGVEVGAPAGNADKIEALAKANGIALSPFASATPPWARIAQIERMRCWFMPIRPVTP